MAPVNIRTREGFSLNRSRPLPFGAYFGMLAQLIPTLSGTAAWAPTCGQLSCVRYRSRPARRLGAAFPQTRAGTYDGTSCLSKNRVVAGGRLALFNNGFLVSGFVSCCSTRPLTLPHSCAVQVVEQDGAVFYGRLR
jgi:hypothetical protein